MNHCRDCANYVGYVKEYGVYFCGAWKWGISKNENAALEYGCVANFTSRSSNPLVYTMPTNEEIENEIKTWTDFDSRT